MKNNLFFYCLTTYAVIGLFVINAWGKPPILPFQNTGDLYVLDHGSGNVLKITKTGKVSIDVSKETILNLAPNGVVEFHNKGLAFDSESNMYFVVSGDPNVDSSSYIIKKNKDGVLSVLVYPWNITAVTGQNAGQIEAVAFGSDGYLYALDDAESANLPGDDSVLKIDPQTGNISIYVYEGELKGLGFSVIDLDCSIVGGTNGELFFASDGSLDDSYGVGAIFSVNSDGSKSVLASGTPFLDLDSFMTRGPSGDLIIIDDPENMSPSIYRVDPQTGAVSLYLASSDLESITGQSVDLEGGIAFDGSGSLYIAEENSDSILKIDKFGNGIVWVSYSDIEAVTGLSPDLEGGIAFTAKRVSPWPMFLSAIISTNKKRHIRVTGKDAASGSLIK